MSITTVTIKPGTSTKNINTILKNNKSIVFEPGVYNVTSTMIFYSNTTIKCKPGVIFKRQFGGRMLQPYIDINIGKYGGVHNVKWIGGKFIANTNSSQANVIILYHCNNIELNDIEVEGCIGLHSLEINSSKNVNVVNCKFYNQTANEGETFREAIQIDFAYREGLKINSAPLGSPCYDATHCNNITIKGCIFDNCPNGIGTHSIYEDYTKYHEKITIEDCKFTNIFCKAAIKLLAMKKVTIKNCTPECKIIINKLKTAHNLSGKKVKMEEYKYNYDIVIDNMEVN